MLVAAPSPALMSLSCPCDAQVDLVDYGMNSVSQGIDALAITRVVIRPVGQTKQGVTPQVNLTPCISIKRQKPK